VYEQQLAAEVAARADSHEDVSLFVMSAVLSEGKKPADAERSIPCRDKETTRYTCSAAELDKAKNQLITNELRELETSDGKAWP
jgi:hypothetical protein